MPPAPDARTVRLEIPARPEYVGLARLALAAVCRLAPFTPADVADLKLAITEAAGELLGGGDEAQYREEGGKDGQARLGFAFGLEERRLTLEVTGARPRGMLTEEHALGRAIVEATVNEWDYAERATRLVKYL